MPRSKMRRRHPRSLLNLPVVEHLFEDRTVRLTRRGVDARWSYAEEIQTNQSGFNPPDGSIFYRANSRVDAWLAHRDADTRKYNYDDSLIGEVMFLVHDHLHVWSYRWIQSLCPEVGLGSAPITRDNLEALTFCHLLTESVATVGLDYWFLCTLDLNRELDLGTDYDSATVSYREEKEDEYRRFCPGFTAQEPRYLSTINRFYCSGEFLGYAKEDLARSPLLVKWLSHELEYGVSQREYARRWLSYLSRDDIRIPESRLGARVATSAPWQRRLVGQLTELLWSKVKGHRSETPPRGTDRRHAWTIPLAKPVDFRFANWNRLQRRRSVGRMNLDLENPENFCHWFRQFISQFDYDAVDPELLAIKMELFQKRRRELCEYFFRDQKRVPVNPNEPEMLFLLN